MEVKWKISDERGQGQIADGGHPLPEGRLVEEDPNCNFHPKQMTREQLQTNYWKLLERLYTPEAFLSIATSRSTSIPSI